MHLVYVIDYMPVLLQRSPSAHALYTLYLKFKDDQNIVSFKYETLTEHYGFAATTLSSAHKELLQLGLIQNAGAELNFQRRKYYVNTCPEPLSRKNRKKHNLTDTNLRERFLETNVLPKNYEKLIDEELMIKAAKHLGNINVKDPKQLARYFGYDANRLQILFESPVIGLQIEAFIQKCIKKTSKTRRTLRSKQSKKIYSAQEIYDNLLASLKREGKPMPQSKWKTDQFLAFFCKEFERAYKTTYVIKDLNELKRYKSLAKEVIEQLGINSSIEYLKWLFNDKAKDLDRSIGFGFVCAGGVMTEFKVQAVKKKKEIKRTTLLPSEFIIWVKENYPLMLREFPCKTYDDLFWLKVASKQENNKEIIKTIKQAEIIGLLEEGKNLKFKE